MAKLKYWMPVDKYFGDAGHTTAHLIYCRFWYKFLYDQGLVPHPEPIHWRMSGGLLLGGDHKKMSKSRPDYVVDPKDVMENYGADAARVYLAFLGPYDESYPWNTNGIKACYRVMREIYEQKSKITTDKAPEHDQVIKAFHKMVKNMTSMMENLKMNTAVSEIMKFVNVLKKHETIPSLVWQDFLKCIAPFAPFLAEELWQEAHGFKEWKNENSVHMQSWPVFDPDLVQDETFELPVQINGKLRATLSVNKNSTETEIHELVLGNNTVKSYLKNRPIEKFVYIPGKIVNLVV